MTRIRCLAFDCFGTVFDMSGISRDEIKAYVDHVKREDFSPFEFPPSWYNLKAHPDAKEGLELARHFGFRCVTLSNGSVELLAALSVSNGIEWDHITDLAKHRAYKPHNLDAYRAIKCDLGYLPSETLMVTANPTFGDVESSAAIGMPSQVIRHGYPNTIPELLDLMARP